MSGFEIGDLVDTDKGPGSVAFYGETLFSKGTWVGIILDEPKGKNNGTVNGVSYFSCPENRGIFVQRDKVHLRPLPLRVKPPTSFIKPPQAIRKHSNNVRGAGALGTGSTLTTPSGTPKLTPASSLEMITRQKSFGNRLTQTIANTPKLKGVNDLESVTNSNFSQKIPEISLNSSASVESRTSSLVKEKALKIDQKSNNSPMNTSVYKLPENHSTDLYEVDYLKKEVKDLNEKLESLRFKRKEDFEKLKEYERNKISLQHLQEFKLEMTQAHSILQKENEELKTRLTELEFESEKNNDVSRLMHQIESIGLDKEMAEEKAELLQSEIDALQLKITKQDSELNFLKSEMEKCVVAGVTGDFAPDMSFIQNKQLQQENERLRDAILRVRDAFSQTSKEVEILRKDVEISNSERNELLSLCEKQERQLDNAKQAIAEFREQVDAAMGSEKMIATLTDKNLNLEEKIGTLEEELNELESLRTVDEEIIESQKEFERDLKSDIERNLAIISDLRRQLIDFDKRAKDYENVILMFRQKNAELKEEIQHLKDDILIIKAQEDDYRGDNSVDDSLSLKVVTLNRTFAEIVASEVNNVELAFSRQQAVYLKSFLPDNFTKTGGDNDCVLICTLFPRMIAKASILVKLLNFKYPPVPNGLQREHITISHKAEQWAHVKKFSYSLSALKTILQKFESVLKHCSVERLSRLSIQQLEITDQEKNLDMYFELLRQNRLDENTSVDNLDRIVNFFQKIFNTNMASETGNCRETIKNVIEQLKEGLLWNRFNCNRLKYFLEISDNETSEFAKFLNDLTASITECEGLSIRALNRIPVENDLLFPSELNEKIMNAISSLEKSAKVIHNACSFAASQLSSIDVDGFSSLQMKEMLHSSVEKYVGPIESTRANNVVTKWVLELKTFLNEISESLENSSMEIPSIQKSGFPPLLDRAYTRKNDVVEAEGLRWQISKKDEELFRLQKLVKAREGDISTFKIRLEMADKQLANSAKSDDTQTQHLQTRCEQLHEDLVKQKNDYEQKFEELKNSLKQAFEERDKECKRGLELSKNNLIANVHQNILNCNIITPNTVTSGFSSGSTDVTSYIGLDHDVLRLQTELHITLNDLKWAEQRIRILEMQIVKSSVEKLREINVPDVVSGVYSMFRKNKKTSCKLELEEMSKEAEKLIEESNTCLLEPMEPQKKFAYRYKVTLINSKIEKLKFRFTQFWNQNHPGEELPTLFNNLGVISIDSKIKTEARKTTDKSPHERCRSILNKWKMDLKRDETLYNKITGKSA